MIDLDDLKKRAESAVGFVDVYLAPDVVLEMIDEIKALRDEVASDNKIIAERDRLLNMFECPEHGQCVPYAMEQVTALRSDKSEPCDGCFMADAEALRRDAMRYQRIRRRIVNGDLQISTVYRNMTTGMQVFIDGEQLDVAIDAAIAPPGTTHQNKGHGHVYPRADGVRMRCGGPGMCRECSAELLHKAASRG